MNNNFAGLLVGGELLVAVVVVVVVVYGPVRAARHVHYRLRYLRINIPFSNCVAEALTLKRGMLGL